MKGLWIGLICGGIGMAGACSQDVPRQDGRDGPRLEKATFLGISTSPATDALREQLGLPKGIGLVIDYVEAGSPAAAGLVVHDVLHKFNDQLMVSPQQLAVLVRLCKPGEKVNLTVVRKGKPVQVDVALGEKEMPPLPAEGTNLPRIQIQPPVWPSMGAEGRQDFFEQMRKELEEAGLTPEKLDQIIDRFSQAAQRRWEGRGRGFRRPDEGREREPDRAGTRDLPGSITSLTDGYSLTVTTDRDGRKRLYAVDKSGKSVFEGPINTPEEIEKVPEYLRAKLKEMEETGRALTPDRPREFQGPNAR